MKRASGPARRNRPGEKAGRKKTPGRWATDGERKKRTDRVGSGRGGGKKPGPNTLDIVQVGWLGYGIIFRVWNSAGLYIYIYIYIYILEWIF
jgi:hypothetical protein